MNRKLSQFVSLFLLWLISATAFADKEDTDTGIEGTEGADNISVTDPTTATATTVAIGAETLTSTATAIDSLGGDDVVTTSIDEISPTIATATAGGAFIETIDVDLNAPPLQPLTADHSVATITSATGIATGDGNDVVNNDSVLLSTSNSVSGANGVKMNASGSGELTIKTEASATASSTGIKTGAGADQVLNSLAVTSLADATAEAVAVDIAASDTDDPSRNVKTNVETNVTAEATANGIETEDDATKTTSESTSPLDGGGLRFTSSETVATVSGDDTVTNTGSISATSIALGGNISAGVSVQSSGTSSSSANVTSTATSNGISTGGGNDSITTTAAVTSQATATAGAIALTVSIANPPPPNNPGAPGTSDDDDVGSSTTNVTASATAIGIDAEGSGHSQTTSTVKEIADGSLNISRQQTASSVAGDDSVVNFGIVDASATATSTTESADVTVSTGGSASTESNSIASSNSTGIFTGAGSDTINNNGTLLSTATSTARSINISVGAGQSADNNNPDSPLQTHEIASSGEGKVESRASAIGIDAEGDATFDSSGFELSIGAGGLSVSRNWGTSAEAGDDTVTNTGTLTSTAGADAETGSVGMQINASGSAGSDTSASANSRSTAIYTGGGNDTISNSGQIDARATSTASAAAVSLTISEAPEADNNDPDVKPGKSNISSDATVTSTANAVGIDAEGKSHNDSGSISLDITRNSLSVTHQRSQTSLAGADTVNNRGAILVLADASSGSVAASVSIETEGSTNTNAESKADANAVGVTTGGGGDLITNDGGLTATSFANAAALSVGVSVSQPQTGDDPSTSILDKLKNKFASTNNVANVTATANSTAIDAEGSEHNVDQTFNTTIDGTGLRVTFDRSSISDAGDDIVNNTGVLISFSEAGSAAGAADVDIQTGGTASAEANAEAKAGSSGILTGGGNDAVTNSGAISADALSAAGTLSVAFSQDGPGAASKSDAKAESKSTSVGIATDNGAADETIGRSLTISENGVDVLFSRISTAQQGADTVINTGLITTSATSASGAVGIGVTIDGAASADVTSTAKSTAIGVDTGGGSDTIDNGGVINTAALSGAIAIGVGFGQNQTEKEKPKVKVEATTMAESSATGIAADSGADTVVNTALSIGADGLTASHTRQVTVASGDDIVDSTFAITTSAISTSGSASVSVAIDGTAKADTESKATSTAAGIVAGGGNDQVANSGAIISTSSANADAIAVAVGQKKTDASKASTVVSGETEAKATATGVAADGGDHNSLLNVDLTIDAAGIDFSYVKSTTAASGDDTLTNSGAVLANAQADTGLLATAVTIKGSARSTVEASATATAHGLDAGGGSDIVNNSGLLQVGAFATANTANVAVSTQGAAIANSGVLDSGTKAKADAFGISSAGAEHTTLTTITTNVDFNDFSVSGSFEKLSDSVSGDGADTITNSGAIFATSLSTTAQANIAVDADKAKVGLALTIGRSESEATASGIASGNADDVINNSGAVTSLATAAGVMGNASVTAKGLAVAGNAAWDGGTVAKATATGIDSDSGTIETTDVDIEASIPSLSAQVVYTKTTEAASGNDTIINSGAVSAVAVSGAATGSVGVAVKGMAASVSTSNAEADAFAIKAGDGDDNIDNTGQLESHATANVATANVSVTTQGLAVAADAVWDGGSTAESTAIGIAGDGGNRLETTRLAIGTEEMSFDKTEEFASGADTIFNLGAINTSATSNAASLSVAVAIKGAAIGTATSTAKATSTAIHAGDGNEIDDVYNGGTLTSTAVANAASASISLTNQGLAIAADSVWDSGTSAEATARGIDVGAGGETLVNDGAVISTATAAALSTGVSVTISGAAGASATSTANADSIALDASDGNDSDTVINSGTLTSNAISGAAAASIAFVQTGAAITVGAVWDGGTGSTARSRGIDVGDASDTVQNTGQITAGAVSGAAEAAVSVALTGVAGAITTATAESDAIAIDAGQDAAADTVINDGDLNVNSVATAATAGISVTQAGLAVAANAVWDGGTNSNSSAAGIDTGDGADIITNSGDINLNSGAATAAGSVSVAVSGVAGASAQATAISDATAIDAGDDDAVDTIDNSGNITVNSGALAGAASVGITSAGVSANWNAGNTADARARGISTGLGDDSISNQGNIDILAGSASGEINVSVAVSGVAGAVSEQGLSRSDATAIDAGTGVHADTVVNSGNLSATATSLGVSASVGVTTAGVAATWNGGTLGNATARGIDVGDGGDLIQNDGNVTATANSATASAAITVAVTGVAAAVSTAEAEADAVAIDTGDDDSDDLVLNSGTLTADSLAAAASASVSVTVAGVAGAGNSPFDGGTFAGASATGAYLGGGNDTLISSGAINANSVATSTGVSIAVAVEGVAGAISAASSNAHAAGVDAGSGDDTIESSNTITASSLANANTISAAGTKFGVSVAGNNAWDGGTTATADAFGISTGDGLDTVINSGAINTDAGAVAPSLTVAFTVAGVAAAISTSTAEAVATAIDTGNDDDQIDNSGMLTVFTHAEPITANVSITGAGVGGSADLFDGGTNGTATSTGIDAGQGADLIINSGDMDIDSSVTADTTSLSVTVAGAAIAASTATSNASSVGIDGGADDDRIENSGNLDIDGSATAIAVNASLTGGGIAGSADEFWDGGTSSNATATGIHGGAGNDTITSAAGVLNDTMANANTASVAVAISGGGYGFAVTQSTSNTRADGINAGDGTDLVINDSDILSTADADATSVSVSVVGTGIAAAGTPNWDGGTTANADSFGISLGTGDDQGSNSGSLTSVANANAFSAAVSAAVAGGLAVSDATSTANATATAMDGGQGADVLVNEGVLAANSNAVAHGLNIAFSNIGPAVAGGSAFFDGGTNSNAHSIGMSGGDGIDGLRNAANATVSLDANARTGVNSVSLSLAGITAAGANANALATGIGVDGGNDNDTLINEGLITGTADAIATGRSISLAGFGGGVAEASAGSTAELTGMLGGIGDDILDNQGSVVLVSTSVSQGLSLSGTLTGVAISAANADGTSNAVGLDGADGADTILNSATIEVQTDAVTTAASLAAGQTGFTLSEAVSAATTHADGIRGGAGNDTIVNAVTGIIDVGATSRVNALGFSIVGLGATGSKAGTEADTSATGIRGDAGTDLILNEGTISVGQDPATAGWMSVLNTSSFSMGLAGASSAESESFARTISIGIDGGDDDDLISSTGTVSVFANALSTSSGSNVTIFGSGGSESTSGALTSASGLLGGLGNDLIESLGVLNVSGRSRLTQTGGGVDFTLAGTSADSAELTATTTALGIGGEDGADTIVTAGSISVNALSQLVSAGDQSTSIFGTSAASATTGAKTRAIGIDGGSDDDIIDNGANLNVDAESSLSLDGASYTFGGTSDSGGTLRATTVAAGLLGGAGMDQIRNSGALIVSGRANLNSTSDSDTSIGGASSTTSSGANVTTVGIDGGDDDDIIENSESGSIAVASNADVSTNAVSTTFLGGSDNQVTMAGIATATGLSGGLGDDQIANNGLLTVDADALLVANGAATSAISAGANSAGQARTTTSATGIDGGMGNDVLVIGATGGLFVSADAAAESLNTAGSTASLTSNDQAGALATTSASTIGLAGGSGDNVFISDGDIDARANSTAYAYARADGATIALAGHATSDARARASARATGIQAADDANTVINNDDLTVAARASTTRDLTITFPILTLTEGSSDTIPFDEIETIEDPALPDPTTFADGDVVFWTESANPDNCTGTTYDCVDDPNISSDGAYYQVSEVQVQQFDANGDPILDADGNPVFVTELQWGFAPSFESEREQILAAFATTATANGHGAAGDGTATATGTSSATAQGIVLGDGNNVVENNGVITVSAKATASLSASSSGAALGDATSRAHATVTATAVGLVLGSGNNIFLNTGDIFVIAEASASTSTAASAGDGICITFLFWTWCGGEGTAINDPRQTLTANAAGVVTGDGDNSITNNGNIVVVARANNPASASVTGIRTGSGDDSLVNNGIVSATIEDLSGTVIGSGIGIDTGAGNDSLQLGDGSLVVGTVNLGVGNDTLILEGNPLITDHLGNLLNPSAGDGLDSLVLMGDGAFFGAPAGFEFATKRGDGTYWLDSLATLDSLIIDGGFLELGSDYAFDPASTYSTFIHGDLSYGGLLVNGVATVDGSIDVARRGDDYIENGTRYSVVAATGGVLGGFTDVTLPEARPLLHFELDNLANAVDVVAVASSFSTTTDIPLHFQVALNLDDIAPASTGGLREQLGKIQMMASDFDTVYAGMAPDMHLALTTNTIAVAHQTTQLLQTHLSNARAVGRGISTAAAAYNPVALAFDGVQMATYDVAMSTAANAAMPAAAATNASSAHTWLMGFAGQSNVDLIDGYTDYDQDMSGFAIGADYMFPSNIIAGASIAFADSEIVMDKAVARTDAETWSGSLYATAFSDDSYVEGGLYFGLEDFTAARKLTIDDVVRDVSSAHDGSTAMAFLGAGRRFAFERWNIEPYVTLYYFDISEDAFAETGADDLNQLVAKKSADALLGELGAKFNWLRPAGNGVIDWHGSIAYNHDFEIDNASIRYAFEGAPTSFFNIEDRNVAGGSAVLGAGLAYIKGRSILSLDYRGQTNGDYQHHVFGARFAYAFH